MFFLYECSDCDLVGRHVTSSGGKALYEDSFELELLYSTYWEAFSFFFLFFTTTTAACYCYYYHYYYHHYYYY